MPPHRPPRAAMPNGHRNDAAFSVVVATAAAPPLGRWFVVVLAILALAIVKPWSASADGAPNVERHAADTLSRATRATATRPPDPAPHSLTAGAIASVCLDPPSWRLTTVERWHDQTIRVWRAIEPVATAEGPDDAQVPVTPLVSEGVIELGWCAPVVAPVRTTGEAAVEVWRRTLDGAAAIRVTSLRPSSEASPYGDLYGPPAARRTTLWNDGTYVFLHRDPDGQESWFAVALALRPATGDPT